MIDIFLNIIKGIRYAAVYPIDKSHDLGVGVLRFDGDGRCRAVHIDFIRDYENKEELLSLSQCFNFPFFPGPSKKLVQHPLGWCWRVDKRRLSLRKAICDFEKRKHFLIATNQKLKTLN